MRRWNPIALYLFLVFVSGSVVGALGYRLYNPPVAQSVPRVSPEEFRHQYVDEMKTRVGMTDDQLKKLNVILDETGARFHDSREKHNLEVKQIREEQFNRIRAMLTPEQLPKYEKARAEREQRNKSAGSSKK
jgi:hypothetical protein